MVQQKGTHGSLTHGERTTYFRPRLLTGLTSIASHCVWDPSTLRRRGGTALGFLWTGSRSRLGRVLGITGGATAVSLGGTNLAKRW
jgi:hypothetical protein